ncbi:pumilio homolog 12-like [Vigna unguiculata]|nr:pumilio homolog 12-like [Vigna unguiculata]
MLVSELQYKFVGLSTDKYASNVVEDLLHYSRTEYAAIIVEEIMESPNFIQVVQDQYGNYVLQRALQYTEGLLYESLRAIILSNRDKLSSCLHGKKVLNVAQKGK